MNVHYKMNSKDLNTGKKSITMKIIVAEDHNIVRQTLVTSLMKKTNFSVVGEAADGLEAVSLVQSLKPDLIIMDMNMPQMSGVEAAIEIRKTNKNVKILILTMFEDRESILDALSADINGYMLKTASFDDLITAITTILSGGTYFDASVARALAKIRQEQSDPENKLTKREIEIIKFVAEGETSKQIGDRLFISTFTVQKHRKNILKKLNLHSTADIVKYSIQHHLI